MAASGAREVVHELLGRCLGPAQPGAGGPVLPTVEQFVRSYFDPRRFEGLPLLSGLSVGEAERQDVIKRRLAHET